MVETCIAKIPCILMACGTGTSVMVGRGGVAGRTIRAANRGVVESGVFEVARVGMAGRASTRIMIGRGTVAS